MGHTYIYIWIMEKKMEATVQGLGFGARGKRIPCSYIVGSM